MPTLDHQDWIADEIEEGPILVLDGSHSQIVLLKHLLGLKQPGLQGGHGAQVSTNGREAIIAGTLGQRVQDRKLSLVFENVVNMAPAGRASSLFGLGQHLLDFDATLAGHGVQPVLPDPVLAHGGHILQAGTGLADDAGGIDV